ncbi:amidohydrolase [Fervidicoccus fontis]|uniref:Amidohydrolase n=2 Tax=Fervidicoccus fontis TaxID=683846 RepID=A0A843AA17_9CREN|nr:amidohydrolase [Fervidicoccus fontis]
MGSFMVTGFVNAKIYASFNPLRIEEAMIVSEGRVVYVGKEGIVRDVVRKLNGKILDLNGRVVLPGFIDSHMHLDELGMFLNMLDLREVKSVEEMKSMLREYVRKARNSWILGHGWDQEKMERWPTRHDLDEVVKKKPVMLTRICMHAAVLNTKAMELSGLINSDLPGVMKDENGIPTGVVKEESFEVARRKFLESLTIDDYSKFLEDAMNYTSSQGVTTVGFVSCSLKAFKALMKIKDEGRMKVRVRAYLNYQEAMELFDFFKSLGLKRGVGDDMLKLMGIKIIADGSLGARTAWLSSPYSDDPENSGHSNIDEQVLMEIVKAADELGLQIAVHGIGDRAIDMIISAYEKLGNLKEKRHRIEHASILRPDQLEKIAELGIAISLQPRFVISDWWIKNRVGEERIRLAYPFKSMIKKGIKLGFSTDSPVESLNPWETVYSSITRGKYENLPIYEFTKDERINLEESLYFYTEGSAYILFEESSLGSLEEGKYADFIVVNRDPFELDEREIRDVKIEETYLSGIRVK